jgi:hypothetical protein
LGFEQKLKSDPRVEQIGQLNPRIEQPELEETEPVTYKFLGFEQNFCPNPRVKQKFLFKPRIESNRVVRYVRNSTLQSR